MEEKEDLRSVLHDLVDALEDHAQLKKAYQQLQPVVPVQTALLPEADVANLQQGLDEAGNGRVMRQEWFEGGPVSLITSSAVAWLQQQVQNLNQQYGPEFQRAFYKKLDSFRSRMVAFPELFPELREHPGIRQCTASRKMRLYFRLEKEEPLVVAVGYDA